MGSKQKRLVVLGFLGTTLDAGKGAERWTRWRPTVGLCRQEELVVDRLELFADRRAESLFRVVQGDVAAVSPGTAVVRRELVLRDPWDFEEVYAALHDFAAAYPWNLDAEDYLVHITTGTHVAQICLFLLVESRRMPARLVQTGPGRRTPDFAGTHHVIDLDLSRYDAIARRFSAERREGLSFLKSGIETRNAAYNALVERMEKVAVRSKDPLLLQGPTGSGKTRLARKLFELKKARRLVTGEFVEANCATLRGDGAMSTLFGHVRGAYTGAVESRGGLLKRADGGVLFLDEIGELGLDEQAMLLRAIEERRFYPVGSDREVESAFQLVAGTNRDLKRAVAEGCFRDDLLARIDAWTFVLPGLRERPEDIEPNLDVELERAGAALNRRVTLTREARAAYLAFARSPVATWDANFRDLAASVRRLATLCEGDRIGVDDVSRELEVLSHAWRPPDVSGGDEDVLADVMPASKLRALDLFDRVQLAEVVRVCRRSKTLSEAGRTLFAVSRLGKTSVNDAHRLRKYLARFELAWDDVAAT